VQGPFYPLGKKIVPLNIEELLPPIAHICSAKKKSVRASFENSRRIQKLRGKRKEPVSMKKKKKSNHNVFGAPDWGK
jgi:hypothetical protein